jgi:single-stranded DNA-binding protein
MNSLNSVILEGVLIDNPDFFGSFTLKTTRRYKKNNEVEEEICNFEIITSDKLAEHMKNYLSAKMFVRVVGRLSEKDRKVTIFAEYIEIKELLK